MNRNNIPLLYILDGEPVSHFRLKEFENRDGLAMVHSSVIASLEKTRRDLCAKYKEEVWVLITDAVRTPEDLQRLAARYGWIDEGGTVARKSKHLVEFDGIAVDMVAMIASTKERVPQKVLGKIARKYFDWVKDDYKDGHVHADNRNQKP